MRYALHRVSGPSQYIITRAEAHEHVRRDDDQTADNDLLDALVAAAHDAAEEMTKRCFCWSTYELRLDGFPGAGDQEIRLPRPPLIRVERIRYRDANGAWQDLGSDNYQVSAAQDAAARVRPAFELSWPETRAVMDAVVVTYVAGYPIDDTGSPADYAANVPASVKQAVKLIVGHLYKHPEAVNVGNVTEIPFGARALLNPFRVVDYGLSS